MEPPTRRLFAFGLLLFAAGAAAGFLAATWLHAPQIVRVVTIQRASPSEGPGADAEPSRPGAASEAHAPPDAPTLALGAEGAPAGSPPATTTAVLRVEPCSVAVRVTTAEGEPVESATVYAMRRADWPVNPDSRPQATTDASGRAELLLPVPGRWDIGAAHSCYYAMRTGVAVSRRTTEEVALRLEASGRIEVELAGAPAEAKWVVTLIDRDGDTGGLPAAGERPRREFTLSSADPVGRRCPVGVALQIREVAVEAGGLPPATWWTDAPVVAPGTLRLEPWRREDCGRLHIEASRASAGGPGERPPGVNFRCRPFGTEQTRLVEADVSQGAARWQCDFTGPPGRKVTVSVWYSFLWRLRTVVEAEFPAVGATTTARTLLPAPQDEGQEPWLRRLEVVGVDGRQLPADTVRLQAAVGEYGTWTDEIPPDAGGASAMAQVGAWMVSEPFVLPSAERIRVVAALGGYVLVHTTYGSDDRRGSFCVSREDGGWLGYRDGGYLPPPENPDAAASWSDTPVSVGPGMLLGPLPAGNVPLRVTLGGVEVGRVVAKVKAGEVTVLSLR